MSNLKMRLTLCTLLTVAAASSALAQRDAASDYPSRPIRFVMPSTPGGAGDIFARTIGQALAEKFGKQVVVDNRPGANGIVGCELVAHAAPDGHTLLMGNSAWFVINPNLYRKLPYDPIADFTPVNLGVVYGYALVVHPSIQARNVQELIALAKAKPGQLTFGTTGLGAVNHLAGEMFKTMTGTDLTHVPYKGSSAALAEVLAGQTSLMFDTLITSVPQIRAGKLRPLGVTLAKRASLLPEVATLNELGLKGYEVNSWQSVLVPAGTPRAIVDKLNATIATALKSPEVIDRLVTQGGNEIVGLPPGPFAAQIKDELARYAKLINTVGLRLE
jgi:tripartite-type tricarboxylate transporter receptor subunit TctC